MDLVRLTMRKSGCNKGFTYMLDYKDHEGKQRRISLGHADKRRAERQQAQKERELRMGIVELPSVKLSTFMEDSLERTGDQIRESTRREYRADMMSFIQSIGDIDIEAVTSSHKELFRQMCLEKGNSPATAGKKLRQVKRFFPLAVERGQLEKHPLKYVREPRVTRRKIRVYSIDECERLLRAAREVQEGHDLQWNLLVAMALTTGLRRSELLNLTWNDVDFAAATVEVQPNADTDATWKWLVKDTDRRTLGLTDQMLLLLVALQGSRPDGYPYVFTPPARYDHIQKLRRKGKWTYSDSQLRVIDNFDSAEKALFWHLHPRFRGQERG